MLGVVLRHKTVVEAYVKSLSVELPKLDCMV